jgi:hypothetical protein
MNEILEGKNLVKVAEDKIHVTGLKGPLEDGWQEKVKAFVARIPDSPADAASAPASARPEPSVA